MLPVDIPRDYADVEMSLSHRGAQRLEAGKSKQINISMGERA